MIMTRARTILLLTVGFFSTILLEIFFNNVGQSSSTKITLLDHIQSALPSTRLINGILLGLILFILFMGLLMITQDHGMLIIYMTVLKFFELIPLLIDLINLLFIYHYKMKDIHQQHSFHRLHLSLILIFIRFTISLDVVRRKYDYRWKRQVFILLDLLLFILINITLIRYAHRNPIRIGRKIVLGILIFQLNDLFYNETFWIDFAQRNNDRRYGLNSKRPLQYIRSLFNRLNMIDFILSTRLILSLFIICLFIFFTFQSIMIENHADLFSISHDSIFLKSSLPIIVICITILYLIGWDTLHTRSTLTRYGISRFCIGFDPQLREISILTTTDLPLVKKEKTDGTCLICYDDKDLNEFDGVGFTDCQHAKQSVCNSCLFHHVQHAFEITFTDDICCPEPECGVKLGYNTVKTILFLNGDDKLVERYDRYVFHRELEQMEEFIWCSNSLCNVGQLNDGGRLNNIVTCYNCHQKTCFSHKVKWHEGITCEEYDWGIDPDDESSRRWIVENSKKCPNCPYQIEKNDGCDHMICIKCRHEFCWSCLADFQPIRQHGNHRHRDICKHYAPYDEK